MVEITFLYSHSGEQIPEVSELFRHLEEREEVDVDSLQDLDPGRYYMVLDGREMMAAQAVPYETGVSSPGEALDLEYVVMDFWPDEAGAYVASNLSDTGKTSIRDFQLRDIRREDITRIEDLVNGDLDSDTEIYQGLGDREGIQELQYWED